jgi:acylphosphatase
MASGLGVRGWVRNRPDGSVEVLGQGAVEDLSQLEDALRRGPAASDVEHVEKLDVKDEVHTFKTFEIR